MATMQREIIRWLSSLDLTQPVRNPQMDLANGFLFAEIISRYDRRVSMHRYSPGCSSECKRRNWKALLDDMKSTGLARTAPDIAEAVIQGKPGAALKILDQLYEYFSGRPAPPRHETVGRAAAALLEVMEVAQGTVEQRGVDSTNCAESLLPAINSEFPLVHVLRQPGFAQPTTTALLRVANSDSRSAKLIGPTPQDELKVVKRNEKLMAEHDMLNKLHRQTNPQRFAHAKRPGIHNVGNKQRKNPMNRAARWDDYHLNVGRASTVHIRSLNDRIISGLRDRAADDGYKNIVEGSVDIDPIEGQMITIFEEANSDLRVSLSRLMGTLLNSVKHAKVWERVYGCSENEDLFSAFVGHCGNMPFSTLTECWGLLMRASGHVAGVLFARPSEFVYLLRALRFVFSPEVLHIRMLHVSSTLRDPVAAEDSSSTNCTVRFDVAGHSVSRGIGSAESGELHYRKQRGVAQGVQALNVASAYRFLCSIGTAVHSLSPPLAFSLLSNYFIPSISKVLPMTSTVIMDAISRVVVSFIYGAIDETNDSKAAETDRRGTLKEELEDGLDQGEKWNPTEQLIALLTGLLKENFMHGGVPESPNYVWWRAQYSLLVRHLLHNGRGDVMLCKQSRTDATSECKSSEDTSDISICLWMTYALKESLSRLLPIPCRSVPLEWQCYWSYFRGIDGTWQLSRC
ncbi:CH like domain [Trypanosoma vivax]|nr:CH like domain [Trypanosoma vivax]